MLTTAAKVKES